MTDDNDVSSIYYCKNLRNVNKKMQEGPKLCLTTINLYELDSTVSTVITQWGLIIDGRW